MNHSPSSSLGAADILALVSRYRAMTVAVTLLSLGAFMTAAAVMPKKYKAHCVLTIYAKYFQNPLIRDMMPEISDTGEMKAQRESMIRQALTPEFLDGLAEKHGLYSPARGTAALPAPAAKAWRKLISFAKKNGFLPHRKAASSDRALARQAFQSRIEVFSLNNTTFQIGFVDPDPAVTFQVTQALYDQVVGTLIETRTRSLVNVRDPIRKRLETMAFNRNVSPDPRASIRPQLVREELAEVRGQLRALGTQYTEDHPVITELRERENLLLRWLDNAGLDPSEEPRDPLVGGGPADSDKDVENDLTRKMDYLNIALESDKANQNQYFALLEPPIFPMSPLWPKPFLFAVWGLAGGLLTSLFLAAVRNYFDRSRLRAEALAGRLGIPYLGELPAVPWNKPLPRIPRAVPAPQLTNGRGI